MITWSFIHDIACVNSDEIWKYSFRKRKKGGGKLEVYVVIWFVHFSPKRAVNMLSLLSGQSFYICAALSRTLPWHLIPLRASGARWCCWRWYGCFKHGDLAPVFVAVSDVFPSREGDYLYGIWHYSNTLSVLSAFGNRSQKFGSLFESGI